jgi:hypothetical protein
LIEKKPKKIMRFIFQKKSTSKNEIEKEISEKDDADPS